MRVLLARHPETVANLEKRFLGHTSSRYSGLGDRQRHALVGSIVGWEPDAVLSSPLERSLVVAREAAERSSAPLRVLDDLAEIDFGAAEGLTYDEAHEAGVPMDYLGGPADDGEMFGGGETWGAFGRRLERAAIAIEDAGEQVAVVTHGGVIRWLLVRWLALPDAAAWRLAIEPASIAVIAIHEGRGVLERFGLSPGATPWERAGA